ncbi:MAG: hypothetical protein QUV05_00780 [Phycisphaerae bacterium]|nr:hypothetical protein [Phycisphaerae bacterium]
MNAMFVLTMMAGMAVADKRIDLGEFARAVEYTGDKPETLEVRELDRGIDGWTAWKGEDGQYMIGMEWDEPRDIAETCIEFRHAVANRETIQVQYWQHHWPSDAAGGWAPLDDPFHGKWVTAKADWWAGDRDISFAFVPYNEEQSGDKAPDMRYRRTYRLRFLCGKNELPPVRYLRAYGPNKTVEATFDIQVDGASRLEAPLAVSVVNGYVLTEDRKTTMTTARLATSPANMTLRFFEGDLESPTRTIVTVRSSRDSMEGFSFLPAEAVKYGIIRIPSLGVVVSHRDSEADLQAGLKPGTAVFDRVATEPEQTWERARNEIPVLSKTRHEGGPLYLPLGPPEARQEIAIRYDASFVLDKSALKSGGTDSDRVRWPADRWLIRLISGEPAFDHQTEGNIKQQLLDGHLPIVINTWEAAGIAYKQTSVAGFLDEKHGNVRGDETVVLMSRLEMTNSGPSEAEAVVRLWNEPHEAIVLEDGNILAKGRYENGKLESYDKPRIRFRANAPDGSLKIGPESEQRPDAVLTCQRKLAAGASETMVLAIPFVTIDTDTELTQLAGLDFDKMLDHEAVRWRRIIGNAAKIEVPNQLLNDFYKAQLSHILITADRDVHNGLMVAPAGTFSYNVCLNESCHQIRALEIRGMHDEAQRFLDFAVQGQSSRGLHGRFTDRKGVLHGMPAPNGDYQHFNYNLDHGFVLWMLNEHYRYTRDQEWLSKVASAMVQACDFVTRQRKTGSEANTLGRDDDLWGKGLLPPGHLEDPPEWLWWFAVNAYAYRGMKLTAESLAEIRHPEADRIAKDAEDFGRCLGGSCRESMVRAPVVRLRDGTYIPRQPTRSRLRGRDLGWIRDALYGPVHLMDCFVYPDDSREAEWILRDTEDNVFIGAERGRAVTDYDRQWFSWGGITLQSNLLPNPLVYLRRGQSKHAIRAFFNSLAANVYEDVRTFCEHPIRAYGIGTGPFFKSPDESAFIVWLRHLLIMEQGDELHLLAGVPEAWLAPGKQIVVERAASWYGPIDMKVASQDTPRQIVLELSGPPRPPSAMKLHVRLGRPFKSVTCNGRQTKDFDAKTGVVVLPTSAGRTVVVVSY